MHVETIKKANFEIVRNISVQQKQVIIQFDDGYKGILDCMPFIISKKIPIEIFIITDFIGKKNYLSQEDIKYLHSTGLVKLSSHTHTHKQLSHCDLKTILEEINIKGNLRVICHSK